MSTTCNLSVHCPNHLGGLDFAQSRKGGPSPAASRPVQRASILLSAAINGGDDSAPILGLRSQWLKTILP